MKNYTKVMATAAAAIAMFVSTNVNAQTPSPTNPSGQKLGVGVILGAPTNSASSFVLGADLRYQIDIDKQLSIPLTTGFTSIFNKDITNTKIPNVNYVPLKAGLKYFLNDSGAGAYALAEAGAAFYTNKGFGTAFVYSPAIGYAFNNGLDLGVKYEGVSKNSMNSGYVGARLAYGFKL